MKKFVTGPKPDNKIVNLETVTNIAFEEFTNRNNEMNWKIIFNFDYGVSLRNDYGKMIADYVYFVYNDRVEYEQVQDELSGLINEMNWIAPMINGIRADTNSM